MNKVYVVILPMFFTTFIAAQEVYTIDSNADDADSYAYDDPNTPADESKDGVCSDKAGRCTLRAAVNEAHNRKTSAIFKFSISGTINLTEPITLEDHCEIEGGNLVELSSDLGCLELYNHTKVTGLKFSKAVTAIVVSGDSNQIGDFPGRNEFLDNGVALQIDGSNNSVYDNYFGLTINDELHPNQIGLLITGSWNTIGGGSADQKNIICGNEIAGISLNAGGESNSIVGNFIGTNLAGASGFGNNQGIVIGGSHFNLIGGYGEFAANIISGNTVYGIFLAADLPDELSEDNWIIKNVIGLNFNHNAAIPNGRGITITNGTYPTYIEGNIIAGNTNEGISIFAYDSDSRTWGHTIRANMIGVNENGESFPNGGPGITIFGHVDNINIGVDNQGGTSPNVIVSNKGGGISVESMFGSSPSLITIRKNAIYQNNNFNLSIDTLSNNNFPPPYALSFNNNTIAGIHNSPNVIIDVYKESVTEVHTSAYQWLGSTTTDANGIFAFDLNDPTVKAVSLTASTDPTFGNTSNFTSLELLTDVQKEKPVPTEFMLDQNYPNPFNPSTSINFSISTSGFTTLKVYDVLGHEVATLVDEYKPAGRYNVGFSSILPSGVYFYKLQAGTYTAIKKMLLLK
jgi:hypothetical protein